MFNRKTQYLNAGNLSPTISFIIVLIFQATAFARKQPLQEKKGLRFLFKQTNGINGCRYDSWVENLTLFILLYL